MSSLSGSIPGQGMQTMTRSVDETRFDGEQSVDEHVRQAEARAEKHYRDETPVRTGLELARMRDAGRTADNEQ